MAQPATGVPTKTPQRMFRILVSLFLASACGAICRPALAAEGVPVDGAEVVSSTTGESGGQSFAVHADAEFIDQGVPKFHAPYSGPDSLSANAGNSEVLNASLFVGFRPWSGAEIWIDPAAGQGSGPGRDKGVAGFLDSEAPRDRSNAYLRLQSIFLRQTFNFSGAAEAVEGEADSLAGRRLANRLVLTVGKFAVTDVFDLNAFAHDAQEDFLSGSIVDAGSFDYASDPWGYAYGGAAQADWGPWSLRVGGFSLTTAAAGEHLATDFGRFQLVSEVERRYSILGHEGALRITAFDTRAPLGSFAAAIRQGDMLSLPPDLTTVRRYRNRAGFSLNLQQNIAKDLGVFLRAGAADGHEESYEVADIDRSLSGGVVLTGARWGRSDDAIGVAGALNDISSSFKTYLAQGGLGLLIGDGRLPHAGPQGVVETFYRWALREDLHLSFDYQLIDHPAYNRDRGPVSVFGVRLHAAV